MDCTSCMYIYLAILRSRRQSVRGKAKPPSGNCCISSTLHVFDGTIGRERRKKDFRVHTKSKRIHPHTFTYISASSFNSNTPLVGYLNAGEISFRPLLWWRWTFGRNYVLFYRWFPTCSKKLFPFLVTVSSSKFPLILPMSSKQHTRLC